VAAAVNPRITLVLVALAAAVGAYVFLVELRREPPPPPGAAPLSTPVPLLRATTDDLTGIEVQAREGRVALTRPAGGEWQFVTPPGGPVDSVRLLSLTPRLAPLNPTRVLTATGPLAQYGLESPATTVTLSTKDGGTLELRVGDQTPAGDGYYVRAGEGTVAILARGTVDELRRLVTEPPVPRPTATPTSTPTAEVTPTTLTTPTPTGTPTP
jgi:hypothetical protein